MPTASTRQIQVLHFVPNEGVFLKSVDDTLKAHQQLVGGNIEIVQLISALTFRLDVTLNEDGIGLNLPSGWVWPVVRGTEGAPGYPIFGSFFVCRSVPDPDDGWIYQGVEDPDIKFITRVFATRVGPLL